MLPEDTLLEIFDFYRLDAMVTFVRRPWKWHRLAHVCRKWRHVLSLSPRRLDLQVLCKYGAPIESILGSWPTLPLVVRHTGIGFWSKHESLPDNVILSLRRPHRLCEIDVVLPRSLIEPIVEAIQEPLQRIECIRVTIEDGTGPPMLVREAFLGGSAPHLREIKLDGISFCFPTIRQVLLSTSNLVELHLANIPDDFYISPDELVTGLSTLVQLKRLTVGFHSPAPLPSSSMTRLFERITLPSLASLNFRGESEYLEEFVDRIDLPALGTIIIELFNDTLFDIPRFCQFIPYLNSILPPTSVTMIHSGRSVSVSFSPSRKSAYATEYDYVFVTSCGQVDWQLSFATQILSQLSLLLSSVQELTIESGDGFPTGEEDVDSTQWLELFRLFTHVKWVNIKKSEFTSGVVRTLVSEDMTTEVLPELTSLFLQGYHKVSYYSTPKFFLQGYHKVSYYSNPQSVAIAAEQFVATRRLSGLTIDLSG